jgi:glycosyltransferase involved in cell wall biosynthesis
VKILLLTQWFEPEPTFKGLLFAQSLRDQGHDVEVLTGFPNYPGGKVYKGYKISVYQKDIIDGITIHRAPLYPSHDSSAIKRVLNYLSFAIGAFIIGLIKTKRIDVVYSYHPPLTTSISAYLLGLFKRVPFVIDVQDLWPDTLSATGMLNNKYILYFVGKVCDFIYKKAAKIVVLSPGFKYCIASRGVPTKKIEIIYNWCNEPLINDFEDSKVKLPDNGKLNLVFAGNLGYAQGLSTIVNAAEILQIDDVNVNVVLLGDGVAKLKAIESSKSKALTNLYFIPRVPMRQVGSLLDKADMLLVHLTNNELFQITIPSKTQAYLAIGKPIIMGVSGDAADLINESNSGFTCEPDNPISLAATIKKLSLLSNSQRSEMGNNGRDFYYKKLSLKIGVSKFIHIFKNII